MKNSKKINGGILGIAAALALVFTQSAFTSAATRYYFYDNQWQTSAPSSQTCVSDPQRLCSAVFDTPPTSKSNLISENPAADEVQIGKLQ
ncbi:hypothetical protein C7T94_02295 [Pedobacter yulinensis]|uniref:Secreted protein n=1 Tax=Pedobacter yulinensis TaxID=2126353 RepID=A0A2T3HRE6_9SPHI|nr:hypothetical protein [Pedobacter yulinensis]PST84971.1 hypothetical protein C7T94_02295 [Pedobacter yulinensis]